MILSTLTDEYFNLDSASPQSVDENWNFFHQNFQQILDTYVPTKTIGKKHLPWMSTALKRMIQKKQSFNCARRYQRECD